MKLKKNMKSGFFENTGKDQGRRRGEGKKKVFHDKVLFLAVQNSSIGDLVTNSLTH